MYLPTEPLAKVTLNLYAEDLTWMRRNYGIGWSTKVRELLREFINQQVEHVE
jgi:hypothetical protein